MISRLSLSASVVSSLLIVIISTNALLLLLSSATALITAATISHHHYEVKLPSSSTVQGDEFAVFPTDFTFSSSSPSSTASSSSSTIPDSPSNVFIIENFNSNNNKPGRQPDKQHQLIMFNGYENPQDTSSPKLIPVNSTIIIRNSHFRALVFDRMPPSTSVIIENTFIRGFLEFSQTTVPSFFRTVSITNCTFIGKYIDDMSAASQQYQVRHNALLHFATNTMFVQDELYDSNYDSGNLIQPPTEIIITNNNFNVIEEDEQHIRNPYRAYSPAIAIIPLHVSAPAVTSPMRQQRGYISKIVVEDNNIEYSNMWLPYKQVVPSWDDPQQYNAASVPFCGPSGGDTSNCIISAIFISSLSQFGLLDDLSVSRNKILLHEANATSGIILSSPSFASRLLENNNNNNNNNNEIKMLNITCNENNITIVQEWIYSRNYYYQWDIEDPTRERVGNVGKVRYGILVGVQAKSRENGWAGFAYEWGPIRLIDISRNYVKILDEILGPYQPYYKTFGRPTFGIEFTFDSPDSPKIDRLLTLRVDDNKLDITSTSATQGFALKFSRTLQLFLATSSVGKMLYYSASGNDIQITGTGRTTCIEMRDVLRSVNVVNISLNKCYSNAPATGTLSREVNMNERACDNDVQRDDWCTHGRIIPNVFFGIDMNSGITRDAFPGVPGDPKPMLGFDEIDLVNIEGNSLRLTGASRDYMGILFRGDSITNVGMFRCHKNTILIESVFLVSFADSSVTSRGAAAVNFMGMRIAPSFDGQFFNFFIAHNYISFKNSTVTFETVTQRETVVVGHYGLQLIVSLANQGTEEEYKYYPYKSPSVDIESANLTSFVFENNTMIMSRVTGDSFQSGIACLTFNAATLSVHTGDHNITNNHCVMPQMDPSFDCPPWTGCSAFHFVFANRSLDNALLLLENNTMEVANYYQQERSASSSSVSAMREVNFFAVTGILLSPDEFEFKKAIPFEIIITYPTVFDLDSLIVRNNSVIIDPSSLSASSTSSSASSAPFVQNVHFMYFQTCGLTRIKRILIEGNTFIHAASPVQVPPRQGNARHQPSSSFIHFGTISASSLIDNTQIVQVPTRIRVACQQCLYSFDNGLIIRNNNIKLSRIVVSQDRNSNKDDGTKFVDDHQIAFLTTDFPSSDYAFYTTYFAVSIGEMLSLEYENGGKPVILNEDRYSIYFKHVGWNELVGSRPPFFGPIMRRINTFWQNLENSNNDRNGMIFSGNAVELEMSSPLPLPSKIPFAAFDFRAANVTLNGSFEFTRDHWKLIDSSSNKKTTSSTSSSRFIAVKPDTAKTPRSTLKTISLNLLKFDNTTVHVDCAAGGSSSSSCYTFSDDLTSHVAPLKTAEIIFDDTDRIRLTPPTLLPFDGEVQIINNSSFSIENGAADCLLEINTFNFKSINFSNSSFSVSHLLPSSSSASSPVIRIREVSPLLHVSFNNTVINLGLAASETIASSTASSTFSIIQIAASETSSLSSSTLKTVDGNKDQLFRGWSSSSSAAAAGFSDWKFQNSSIVFPVANQQIQDENNEDRSLEKAVKIESHTQLFSRRDSSSPSKQVISFPASLQKRIEIACFFISSSEPTSSSSRALRRGSPFFRTLPFSPEIYSPSSSSFTMLPLLQFSNCGETVTKTLSQSISVVPECLSEFSIDYDKTVEKDLSLKKIFQSPTGSREFELNFVIIPRYLQDTPAPNVAGKRSVPKSVRLPLGVEQSEAFTIFKEKAAVAPAADEQPEKDDSESSVIDKIHLAVISKDFSPSVDAAISGTERERIAQEQLQLSSQLILNQITIISAKIKNSKSIVVRLRLDSSRLSISSLRRKTSSSSDENGIDSSSDDLRLKLAFDSSLFACRTTNARRLSLFKEKFYSSSVVSIPPTSTQTRIPTPTIEIPKTLADYAEAGSRMGMILGGASVGSAFAKSNAIISFADCSFSMNLPMQFVDSPTNFGFGDERGYWKRGALLGNFFFLCCISSVLLLIAAVRVYASWRIVDNWHKEHDHKFNSAELKLKNKIYKDEDEKTKILEQINHYHIEKRKKHEKLLSWTHAIHMSKLPSSLTIPMTILTQGTFGSAVGLLLVGNDYWDRVLGFIFCVAWTAWFYWMWHVIFVQMKKYPWLRFVKTPNDPRRFLGQDEVHALGSDASRATKAVFSDCNQCRPALKYLKKQQKKANHQENNTDDKQHQQQQRKNEDESATARKNTLHNTNAAAASCFPLFQHKKRDILHRRSIIYRLEYFLMTKVIRTYGDWTEVKIKDHYRNYDTGKCEKVSRRELREDDDENDDDDRGNNNNRRTSSSDEFETISSADVYTHQHKRNKNNNKNNNSNNNSIQKNPNKYLNNNNNDSATRSRSAPNNTNLREKSLDKVQHITADRRKNINPFASFLGDRNKQRNKKQNNETAMTSKTVLDQKERKRKDPTFFPRTGEVYYQVRGHAKWYLLVEFAVVYLIALCSGIQLALDDSNCDVTSTLVAVINCVPVAFIFALWPFSDIVSNLFAFAAAVFLCGMCLATALADFFQMVEFSNFLISLNIALGIFGSIKIGFDFGSLVITFRRWLIIPAFFLLHVLFHDGGLFSFLFTRMKKKKAEHDKQQRYLALLRDASEIKIDGNGIGTEEEEEEEELLPLVGSSSRSKRNSIIPPPLLASNANDRSASTFSSSAASPTSHLRNRRGNPSSWNVGQDGMLSSSSSTFNNNNQTNNSRSSSALLLSNRQHQQQRSSSSHVAAAYNNNYYHASRSSSSVVNPPKKRSSSKVVIDVSSI